METLYKNSYYLFIAVLLMALAGFSIYSSSTPTIGNGFGGCSFE